MQPSIIPRGGHRIFRRQVLLKALIRLRGRRGPLAYAAGNARVALEGTAAIMRKRDLSLRF